MQSRPKHVAFSANFVAVLGYFSEVYEYVANSRPINRLSKI